MTKYKARRTTLDGITFDSAAEARRWAELKLLERAGEIERLERQVKFPLDVDGIKIASYIADFVYFDKKARRRVVEDVKSAPTAKLRDFVMKRKLMRAIHKVDVEVRQ